MAWGLARVLVLAFALALAGAAQPTGAASDLLTPEQRAWLAAHPEIVIGFPENQPPAVIVGPDGRLEGVFVELLDLLNDRLGTDIRIALGPWGDLVARAERRDIDMLGFTFALDTYRDRFTFTDTVLRTYYYLYARSDDPAPPDTLAALTGKRVGYIQGTRVVEALLAGRADVAPVPLSGNQALAAALLAGRIDVILTNISLEYWRKSYTQTGFRIAALVPEMGGDLVIAVRNDWPELTAILNAGLATITAAERQAIIDRWLGSTAMPREVVDKSDLDAAERAWLAEHPVIRVGVDPAWAPVNFVDADGAPQGISIAYLERLERSLGMRFEMITQPSWTAAMAGLASGELDLLPAVAATPEREQAMRLSEPYVSFPAAIFSAAEIAYLGGPDNLAGKVVAVVRGDAVEAWLRETYPELTLLPVTDTREGLRQLTRGDADAYVGNVVTTSYAIGQTGLTRIKVVGETPFSYRLAMAVGRDQPLLAGVLQKGLETIPQQARDAIYNEWISIRYSLETDWTVLWRVVVGAALVIALIFLWNRRLAGEIERRRQAEVALREAKEAADQANRAKSTFLANVSHELRTPLNLVLGFASLLDGRARDDRERGWLDGIGSAGRPLAQLIDDLLDLSRIEAGRLELEPTATDVRALLRDLTAMFAQAAADKGLRLTLTVDDTVPPVLVLDPKCVRQVLVNLLGNALKFTDTGRIEVRATMPSAAAGEARLGIAVEDTGRGIDDEERQRIFGAFDRGSDPGLPGGAGLGLAISRRLAEAMGGDIRLESTPGRGSTFTLELPVQAAAPAAADHAAMGLPAHRPVARFAPASLLIVDDRTDNRELLGQYLRDQPFTIIEAGDGAEALDLAREHRPDLILMDLAMPGMNGRTAAARLKADPATAAIPVLAVTATALTDGSEALHETFDGVLLKPLGRADLLDSLARWLAPATPEPERSTETAISAEDGPSRFLLSPALYARLHALKPPFASINDIQDIAAALQREADASGDGAVRQAAADLSAAAKRFDPSALTQRIEALQERADRRPTVSAA